MAVPTMTGITASSISTDRLTTRVLFSGPNDAIPVLFIHGNASSATLWEDTMLALPGLYRGVAPDQRGFGDADPAQKIDARRGLADLADDMHALLNTLGLARVHVVGHSFGGSVIWRMLLDYPERLLSVTLVCPGSPYGFGGTKDEHGAPCYPDFAGSGAGLIVPEVAQRIADQDRSADNPHTAPRRQISDRWFKPPFHAEREEEFLSALLSTHVGPQDYPGESVTSPNWPYFAPGVWGFTNAISPKYACDVSGLYRIVPKPPILWIRGSQDQIIADQSLADVATYGPFGIVHGWPGASVFPSQPMLSQTRAVLEKYAEAGGSYREAVIADAGHTPYIEKPAEFNELLHAHIRHKL